MANNSFEFFPPRTPQGKDKLRATWQELAKLKPRFFSCTYGAGGSTRDGTLETVLEIRKAGHEAAPHISCVASTKQDIGEQLERYKANGIRHLVALRGDLPSGLAASGEFRYASELVAFIRGTHRRLVPHRSRLLSRVPPADAQRRRRGAQLQEEGGRRRRTPPSRSTSTTPTRISASWTSAARPASPCRSSRA